MKTNELKSLLEKIDYSVKRINGMIVIENEYGNAIATIEENTTFKFSTQYYAWNFIPYSEQKIILPCIMRYAGTPVDEREEETRFYLEHRYFRFHNGSRKYLGMDLVKDKPDLCSKITYRWIKNQFTEKEIDEIEEEFDTDLKDFELVEVEE
ncbi:hypothetical protein [Anaerococcus hydrogenalis]|uniref:hypothetical protein n=1 Tax=Anaerococcus hydrogenalis TaxID=33029 RepID=UPI001D6DE09E|nr:hypothetical protein [Anaerococcus hydrogenalis]MBS5989695.1 hypothetical protein [Anaerococcus hydrogenalis]